MDSQKLTYSLSKENIGWTSDIDTLTGTAAAEKVLKCAHMHTPTQISHTTADLLFMYIN